MPSAHTRDRTRRQAGFCSPLYVLATVMQRQVWTIHLSAAMACGAVWQLLTYLGVPAEFYTLAFALVGLGLLVVYRFALLKHFAAGPLAGAAFQSGNTPPNRSSGGTSACWPF